MLDRNNQIQQKNEGVRNYVESDISVICDKNKLDDRSCKDSPDWIIGIILPIANGLVKLFKYRTAGVKEYWIVAPLKD